MVSVAVSIQSPLVILIVLAMSGMAATLLALLAMQMSAKRRRRSGKASEALTPPSQVLAVAAGTAAVAAPAAVPPPPLADPVAQAVRELDALIVAAEAAVRSGRKDLQAATRMQLADVAKRRGDSTTACEHWQMARMLFHDIGDKAGFKDVDEKMRANGCPTDWVLTDF